jgi:hypothetical protein
VDSIPDESSGLAEAHAKISANGNPKSISTFGFALLIPLPNQKRQENNLLRENRVSRRKGIEAWFNAFSSRSISSTISARQGLSGAKRFTN